MLRNTNRTHAGTTSTVRDGKCFMQIQVAYIGTDHTRTGESHLSIHVGTVHVDLTTVIMNDLGDFFDTFLVYSMSGRIGHHQNSQLIAVLFGFFFQFSDVDIAFVVALHHHYFHAGHYSTCRVGAVCR